MGGWQPRATCAATGCYPSPQHRQAMRTGCIPVECLQTILQHGDRGDCYLYEHGSRGRGADTCVWRSCSVESSLIMRRRWVFMTSRITTWQLAALTNAHNLRTCMRRAAAPSCSFLFRGGMAALLRSAAGMLHVCSDDASYGDWCWCDVCRVWVGMVPIGSAAHQSGSRHRRNRCVIEVHMALPCPMCHH